MNLGRKKLLVIKPKSSSQRQVPNDSKAPLQTLQSSTGQHMTGNKRVPESKRGKQTKLQRRSLPK